MFHISFLLRDKHLAEVLHSLENKALNLAVNPTKHNDDIMDLATERKPKVAGEQIEAALAEVAKTGNPFTLETVATQAQCSKSGAHRVIRDAVKSGALLQAKQGKTYIYRKGNTDGLASL